LENYDAQKLATKLQEIYSLIQAEKSFAQAKQQENADWPRNPTPVDQVEDLVWLNARNIITYRHSVKLDYKLLGPFLILALIGKICLLPPASLNNTNS
jgi:hypothetical protein